jgi:outer membrane protein OmpA-like peptidoglycan-associated protein
MPPSRTQAAVSTPFVDNDRVASRIVALWAETFANVHGVERTEAGLVFRGRLLFQHQSAELTSSGRGHIDQLARTLLASTEVTSMSPNWIVRVTSYLGRSDCVSDDRSSLIDLTRRRADAIGEQLATRGLERTRIRLEGRGGDEPVEPACNDFAKLLNDRVVLQFGS